MNQKKEIDLNALAKLWCDSNSTENIGYDAKIHHQYLFMDIKHVKSAEPSIGGQYTGKYSPESKKDWDLTIPETYTALSDLIFSAPLRVQNQSLSDWGKSLNISIHQLLRDGKKQTIFEESGTYSPNPVYIKQTIKNYESQYNIVLTGNVPVECKNNTSGEITEKLTPFTEIIMGLQKQKVPSTEEFRIEDNAVVLPFVVKVAHKKSIVSASMFQPAKMETESAYVSPSASL